MTERDWSATEWPVPPSHEIMDRVELNRRQHRQDVLERAALSPAKQEQLDGVFRDMNRRIELAFDRMVAQMIRDRLPLPSEKREQFLTEFAAAVQASDDAAARLDPALAAAMASLVFTSSTQLDAENAHRVATFHRRCFGSPSVGTTPRPPPD